MWQLDDRLRRYDAPYQRIGCPEYDPISDAKKRSLARITLAIVCTLVTLAIVAVCR